MDTPVHRAWWPDADLVLAAARTLYRYGPGEDRATGYLYGDGQRWPPILAEQGEWLLSALDDLLGVRFPIVAFQAYLDGSGCDWHTDTPFDVQAVLSLGVDRRFGVRPTGGEPVWINVRHGDLLVMPSGFQARWEHCVPVENVTGERVSLVFRTPVGS